MATQGTVSIDELQQPGLPLRDPVQSLRIWGTPVSYDLDAPGQIRIGASPTCEICIPRDVVSGVHCRLERCDGHLLVRDQSKNGTYVDHVRVRDVVLGPAAVLTVGDVHLIAMSAEAERVAVGLRRHLGYADRFQTIVDSALHATARRRHLLLREPPGGAAAELARWLSAAWADARRPFVEVDRVPDDVAAQGDLLDRAQHGAIAVEISGLPPDPATFPSELVRRGDVQLIVRAPHDADERRIGPVLTSALVRIEIPALIDRVAEVPRLLEEVRPGIEARTRARFPSIVDWKDIGSDLDALGRYSWPRNFAEVDEVLETVLVVRAVPYREAARLLGMSPTALHRRCKQLGLTSAR